MLIRGFGLFWRRDEIECAPGAGNKTGLRLLGRHGANAGTIRVINARQQSGIYILYGNLGPYYVGLTMGGNGLGERLRDHTKDDHKADWDRFSWFGFKPILKGKDASGFNKIGVMAESKPVKPTTIIRDVEALLIRSMSVWNSNQMNFVAADEWTQIREVDRSKYLSKISSTFSE